MKLTFTHAIAEIWKHFAKLVCTFENIIAIHCHVPYSTLHPQSFHSNA